MRISGEKEKANLQTNKTQQFVVAQVSSKEDDFFCSSINCILKAILFKKFLSLILNC
jgi:hypothetical protein